MLPALQSIFRSLATLKHDIAAVDLFYNDLNSHGKELDRDLLRAENDFSFEKTLSLNNLNFQYPGS